MLVSLDSLSAHGVWPADSPSRCLDSSHAPVSGQLVRPRCLYTPLPANSKYKRASISSQSQSEVGSGRVHFESDLVAVWYSRIAVNRQFLQRAKIIRSRSGDCRRQPKSTIGGIRGHSIASFCMVRTCFQHCPIKELISWLNSEEV